MFISLVWFFLPIPLYLLPLPPSQTGSHYIVLAGPDLEFTEIHLLPPHVLGLIVYASTLLPFLFLHLCVFGEKVHNVHCVPTLRGKVT